MVYSGEGKVKVRKGAQGIRRGVSFPAFPPGVEPIVSVFPAHACIVKDIKVSAVSQIIQSGGGGSGWVTGTVS